VLGFAVLHVEREGGGLATLHDDSKELRLRAVSRYALYGKQIM